MELKDYQFPQDLENQIYSLSLIKNSSASEVVQMVLRNHFSLPIPKKWNPDTDSWITSSVDIVYEQIGGINVFTQGLHKGLG